MILKYEYVCPRCKSRYLNLIDGDNIFEGNKVIGKIVWYRCTDCNNVFGYYVLTKDSETIVIEISLNNS